MTLLKFMSCLSIFVQSHHVMYKNHACTNICAKDRLMILVFFLLIHYQLHHSKYSRVKQIQLNILYKTQLISKGSCMETSFSHSKKHFLHLTGSCQKHNDFLMTKKTNDVGSTERLAISVLKRHFVLRKAYFKKESSASLLLYKQQESPVSTTTS